MRVKVVVSAYSTVLTKPFQEVHIMPNLPRPKVPIRENASTMIGKPTLYATTYNQWDLEKLPTVDEVQVERVKYEAERQYDTKPM